MIDLLLPEVALMAAAVMFLPAMRHSRLWRATVTPLASIIGSGFLISEPLLSGSDRVLSLTLLQRVADLALGLAAQVAAVLPGMLVLGAAMSQFSAAVADTAGAGGLFHEISSKHLRPRLGYCLLVVVAIALIWAGDVFEIVALASRLFAFYYLLQCLVALTVCVLRGRQTLGSRLARALPIALLAVVLAGVVLFAIPVG
ncbi:MAG: hypothetical protein R3E83_19815 [Burkholderiaceae bacterium]